MADDVFQVNQSSFFDEVSHTQGGMPHLVQYLWDTYCNYLAEQLKERKVQGKSVTSLQEAKKRAPASHFARWASDFLKENRVIENFYIDANHGIRLASNQCLAICPGTIIQGTMQESNSVPITESVNSRNMDSTSTSFNL